MEELVCGLDIRNNWPIFYMKEMLNKLQFVYIS